MVAAEELALAVGQTLLRLAGDRFLEFLYLAEEDGALELLRGFSVLDEVRKAEILKYISASTAPSCIECMGATKDISASVSHAG
jgi:hypothetical protein